MDSGLIDVTEGGSIRIDINGHWSYNGQKIINHLVIRAFYNALDRDGQGRYRIIMDQEICYIEVEDTPFIVSAIRGDNKTGVSLILNNGMEEIDLDPSKLWVENSNILYAGLDKGQKARFSRPAYYNLALMMEEDSQGRVILDIAGKAFPICMKAEQ
ncbi:MAG: DUF1285 domain-containing protein [Thermodesulfobacteriota bacterium]|nr:DUF1285 domain-containing protein [Thermodesulfobacteriota bacterium]